MKTSELKQLIKEAVRDAIRDEMKDILLEALKTPKTTIRENHTPTTTPEYKPTFTQPTFDAREKYANILGETAMSFTSRDVNQFNPAAVGDPVNGNLGNGELGMDQIMNLLNGK
jgi:hypothetical protein